MFIKDESLIEEKKRLVANSPNLTKENSSFEEWWNEVVSLYTIGWLDQPMTACAGKLPYYENWYVPTIDQVIEFKENIPVKNMYKFYYEEGKTPANALIYMY